MTDPAPTQVPAQGLLSRVIGVIFSPRATFERLVLAPRVLGAILLVGLVIGLSQGIPQLTETGKQAAVDSAVQQMERFRGRPVTDDEYSMLQRQAPFRTYATFAFAPAGVAASVLFFSVIYFIAFNVVLGGAATFKQVASIAAHSAVISALGAMIGAPIQMLQGTFSPMGPFTLGALMPMLDEGSFLARFLGVISVFSIWGTIVTAIGFSVLYRRKTSNIAIALFALTAVFAAIWATVLGIFSSR
jgi:Yip1-like protein